MTRRLVGLLGVVGVVLAFAVGGCAQVALADFQRVLSAIPVTADGRILSTLDRALRQEGFPAADVERLFERLLTVPAAASDKEAVILTVVAALEEGIPVDGLLNKAFEGLARGVSLAPLNQLLQQRLRILIGTCDLLYAKGIFRASAGAPTSSGALALPTARFDAMLSQLGDALGDYLESGGSPHDGNLIYQDVEARLTMLRGSVLVPADVDLVLGRLVPEDLTRVVLAALN
ncbi:MAG: hypothetical protein NTY63_01280 [Candidatus Bipolaricaulota bacterium]|nr:hypothetical protein [Candidatus Bipolaricaulota bacterium]